ncbi:MAG: DUF1592 domain-containing protein [Pirellulales bacterium]|nr:DUF1592 domain-containing protein [Pirellulales bacterium]
MLDKSANAAKNQFSPSRYHRLVGSLLGMLCGGLLLWGNSDLLDSSKGIARGEESSPASATTAQLSAEVPGKVVPFIKKYCVDCHAGKEAEAGIDLEKTTTGEQLLRERRVWRTVASKLRNREMPPSDHDTQPAEGESDHAAALIEGLLKSSLADAPIDPGRVTIRRLNRAEYNNTIRDLVGVDFRPAEDFPSDDVGYGFDNIGDVLAMPPILLEKYFLAAEKIMDRAIVVPDPAKMYTNRMTGAKLTADNGGRVPESEAHLLTSDGAVRGDFNFPTPGEYQVRIEAWGDQAGPDPARMSLKIDDKALKTWDVANDRFKPRVFQIQQEFSAGNKRLAVSFDNDYYLPKNDDPKKGGDRNLIIHWVEVRGPLGLDESTLPATHKQILFVTPPKLQPEDLNKPRKRIVTLKKDPEKAAAEKASAERRKARRDAAEKIIDRFASRAFRRPATSDELERLLKIWETVEEDKQPFERGIQLACTAVLVSPHFLYRIELDPKPDDPNFVYELNDFELATRLSYFLWNSMPDDELFALAEKGALRQGNNLAAQVKRMMRDRKAQALVDNFGGQWLQTRRLADVQFDTTKYSAFDDQLRAAMQKETTLFFATLLVEDRSVLEFLDADFTFLNERLALHYGFPGIAGDHFRRVDLSADNPLAARRGGLLGMAGILALNSNPTRTSPVKRGKWIMETLLGTPPPPAPPEVPKLEDDKEDQGPLVGTLKQRMEQHRANPMCASCHRQMDSMGFGLENFDALGAWREQDGTEAIDASGVLPGNVKFSGPVELKQILKSKKELFVRCLTEKMLTYAVGRGLEEYDEVTVDRIAAAMASQDYRFSALLTEIVNSAPFQQKRGAGVRP